VAAFDSLPLDWTIEGRMMGLAGLVAASTAGEAPLMRLLRCGCAA
jgi:hypothetical protein